MSDKKSFLHEDTPSFTKVVLGTVITYNIFVVLLGLTFFVVEYSWEKFKNWLEA